MTCNIVIPMAGKGSRFADAGYKDPKPFIDVGGMPMIQRVVENLTPYQPYRFIFLARREHEEHIKAHMSFATDIIYVDEVTEGAACTVLLAEHLIDNRDELIIANSDQLVVWNNLERVCHYDGMYFQESDNIQDIINDAKARHLSASIATFPANHPKWSYAKLNDKGFVSEVAEKRVISNHATVGVYWYRHGQDFVRNAKRMIECDVRVNGEFYVCPVFNQMLIESPMSQIGIYPVYRMYGMGTPEDLVSNLEVICGK